MAGMVTQGGYSYSHFLIANSDLEKLFQLTCSRIGSIDELIDVHYWDKSGWHVFV